MILEIFDRQKWGKKHILNFFLFFLLFYIKNVLKSFEILWLENNEICEKEITAPLSIGSFKDPGQRMN